MQQQQQPLITGVWGATYQLPENTYPVQPYYLSNNINNSSNEKPILLTINQATKQIGTISSISSASSNNNNNSNGKPLPPPPVLTAAGNLSRKIEQTIIVEPSSQQKNSSPVILAISKRN